jgi:hypothetical protein
MNESTPKNASPELVERGLNISVEENKKLEAFARYGFQEVLMEMNDLESQGFGKIETVDKNISLDKKVIDDVKIELGTEEKLFTISEKALHALKKVVIAGMTTLALASNAEAKMGDMYMTEKNEIKPVENVLYGAVARDNMISRTQSETYLNRLIKETGGDVAEAKRIQQERLKNLQNSIFLYTNDLGELNAAAQYMASNGFQLNTGDTSVSAFSAMNENPEHKSRIAVLTKEKMRENVTHELSHLATHLEHLIPPKSQERLSSLLKSSKLETKSVEYFKQPTEVLARKHAIDEKMEQLGIKKYEEVCTQEHFQKLLRIELEKEGYVAGEEITQEQIDAYIEMRNNDILPEGLEFIFLYGLEDAEKLFNEVAQNEGNLSPSENESEPA